MGARRISQKRYAAFTLLELVITVGIVLVLAAILFPIASSVRASAQSVKCTQKLKSLYVATLAFVDDYNGLLPPDLGMASAANIHPKFSVNMYWWDSAYLGRYVLNEPNRKRDSTGKLKASEMGPYLCPARFVDGSDESRSSVSSPTSYVMQKLFQNPKNYQFRTMENKSEKLFLAEGRGSTLIVENAFTGKNGVDEGGKRLRRLHGNAMNILFFDGHVLHFAGADEEIAPWIKSGNN